MSFFGLFGGDKSSSNTTNESLTQNTDNRIANDSGLVASGGSVLESDNSLHLSNQTSDSSIRDSGNSVFSDTSNRSTSNTSTVTNVTDGGAVRAAMDAATSGYSNLVGASESIFNTARKSNSQDFANLLGTTEGLFTRAANSNSQMAGKVTEQVAQAYDNAKASQTGNLDNKTIMILGVAAAVALAVMARGH